MASTTGGFGGFSFGGSLATSKLPTTTATTGGFSLGNATDANQGNQKAVRFGTSTTSASSGFSFTTPATASATPTLSGLLSGNKPSLALGIATTTTHNTITSSITATTTSASASISSGFNFSSPAATTGLSLGSAVTQGFASGGLTSGTTTSSIFGMPASTTASQGLGGVDPKTASSSSGNSGGTNKPCDSRAVKENLVDPIIVNSIDEFVKHVKNQKNIRENIGRMSSKPLCKVKDEMKNLQQQLMLVSNGLQKNSAAIAKLKKQVSQELKYAEMAQRTKDTPPGLQYENTAPTEFFHHLTEEFEIQMMIYRQQIADTENHLMSLNQSSMLTPQEMSQLFTKLNDGFVALAAQLQVVHETVKAQKEQYLEFRKFHHGDTTDIFARHKKVQASVSKPIPTTVGPTPFSATAPGGIGVFASSTQTGLVQQPTAVLGSSSTIQTAANTGSMFGNAATSGTGTLFGSTAAPTANLGAGLGAVSGSGIFGGTGTGAFGSSGFGGAPTLNFLPATTTGQTQKPFGSKRGKNA